MPINLTTSLAAGADMNLSPVSVQQFSNITPVDFSASVPAGSRAYSIDIPEGLEVMSKALRVIGAPVNTQAETTANIYIVPPSGSPFWCRLPITVTTPAGAVYDNGGAGYTNGSFITSLSEFGAAYTGPGCTVLLAAGANITVSSLYNRFQGLTSQIVVRSIDPANPATINGWQMDVASGAFGNVALVDLKIERDMDTGVAAFPPGAGFLPTFSIVSFPRALASNISVIRCAFKSNVLPASDKPTIRQEMCGIRAGGDRLTVWGCTFRHLFNGILNNGTNTLMGRCAMEECWGDLWRMGPFSSADCDYVMACDNWMGQCTADGSIRHSDLVQIGGPNGVGTGAALNHVELRGNISSDGTLDELPAVSGQSNSGYVVASTNQTASLTDDTFYRMETDVAGGNLTVQLPATGSVASGWSVFVQKYSADTTHSVTVLRNGSDTINGVASNFVISGRWKAYRFTRSGSNWAIELFGLGHQHGIYQQVGSLTEGMHHGLIWANGTICNLYAGHSFEIPSSDFELDYCTLVRTNAGDRDGDGVLDRNDYWGASIYPSINLRNNSTAEIVVRNSAAAHIARDTGITFGNITQVNNDVGQGTGAPASIAARFIGGGALVTTRLDALRGMRHVEGGPLDGTGIGAVWKGVADGPYDFINMRPRLPGAPTVTTAPVISGSDAAGFTISTAAVFSASLPTTHQWLRDGVPIPGATGTTYAGDAGAASGSKVSLRVTGASALGDAIADSVNEITKP